MQEGILCLSLHLLPSLYTISPCRLYLNRHFGERSEYRYISLPISDSILFPSNGALPIRLSARKPRT